MLGGPEAPEPEERFTTAARAANARESTPLELKSDDGCRFGFDWFISASFQRDARIVKH